MCNACGFSCCAWDGFSGCGCDDCDCPDCWDDEEELDDDEDYYLGPDDEDDRWGCDVEGCLMQGDHMRSECHTAADLDAMHEEHERLSGRDGERQ